MTHRQLTKTLIVGALVGTLASCAQNSGPFFISSIALPGPGCTANTTTTGAAATEVGATALAVTAGGSNFVPMVVTITGYGDVSKNTTSNTSGSLDTQGKVFYIDQASYVYDSTPAPKLVGLVPETRPVLFPVLGDVVLMMPFIGDGAAAKLPGAMSPGDVKRLLVTLELRGREGGSGARFSTGPVTFPIDLLRTPDCASGTEPVLNSANCYDTCYQANGKPQCYDPAVGPPSTDGGC